MEDIETLKAQVKKMNAQATQLKMDLHDLSEDLPVNWESIPAVAARTYEAYKALTEARMKLSRKGTPTLLRAKALERSYERSLKWLLRR